MRMAFLSRRTDGAKGLLARYGRMNQTSVDIPAPENPGAGKRGHGLSLLSLARTARRIQLSGAALVGVSVSLTVLAAALLLWDGLATGVVRVVLLLAAAVLLRLRLLSVRLGAMTPMDGVAAPAPKGVALWMSPIESVVLLLAAGLDAFGAHHDEGIVVAVVASVLLVIACLRRRGGHSVSEPSRPHPNTVLAVVCLASMFEGLWGWRGQTLVIGLGVIAAILAVQALRPPRTTAAG
jgi:hypothetical protein